MKLRFKKSYVCEECGKRKKSLYYSNRELRCNKCFSHAGRSGSLFKFRKKRIKVGKICKLCGVIFTKEHGIITICDDCRDFANKQQQADYGIQIYREIE